MIVILFWVSVVLGQKDPNFFHGRTTIVHLFEWKWNDIADECERFLGPKKFGGVQISPPNEYLIVTNRPWWERYQPVSYTISTRSGNESDFINMSRKCNAVGVRIYVDAVINHMSGMDGIGTAGSTADHSNKNYPSVPYSYQDFHNSCQVNNYQDANNVRDCELVGLSDLNHSLEHVREKIIQYLNHMIDLGVAGFRIDAAKHMWPKDLEAIYASLKNLNPNYGFASDARPFIYQEVIDLGGEAISKHEYTTIGAVLDFQYGSSLCNVFKGNDKLASLENWGPDWNLVASEDAVVFIDNHDNQRGGQILTYKDSKLYKMATVFMLAHPYGVTRIMSSYNFDAHDEGPPQDDNGEIISPSVDGGTCRNGWVCEHRWREISNMVGFRNAVFGTNVTNWWSDGNQQIAFSRGNKGFVVFAIEEDLNRRLYTGLPAGFYSDMITGKIVCVCDDGYADISLEADGVLAIHINAKI